MRQGVSHLGCRLIGLFFATNRISGLTPEEFFGIAFWIGFVLHLLAAEAWILVDTIGAHGCRCGNCLTPGLIRHTNAELS